jgi:hypothetical protein
MAYEKNKQTPSRTLRYYHVQDYLLRPSCSIHKEGVHRRPFLLIITVRLKSHLPVCFFFLYGGPNNYNFTIDTVLV